MTLHVTHVYRTYYPDAPGGLQEAIRQIALGVKAQGLENTVFTLSPNPEPRLLMRPEGEVVRHRSWAAPGSCDLGGPAAFRAFADYASRSDVMHYLFPWPFADLLHAVVRPQAPSVMTYISDVVRQRWLGRLYAPLMWRTLDAMRIIVANAPAYAQTSPILSHPRVRDKVRVIPLGIDEASYPQKADERILTRLALAGGSPYFLFIGVLRYYKGLEYLVRAARNVSVPIVIAGSGPERERLRVLCAREQATNVVFADQVTDEEKVALLKHCEALVLPSHLRSEAFGMVLVEAAMYSRPLISCEINTGTSFVNAHDESGIVVPPARPDALADAMNLLLANRALARRFGHGARVRYERLFSGEAVGDAYARLFREVAT